MGHFADIPEPIWYNPNGIANILSLARLKRHYRITYDSHHGDCFTLLLNNGTQLQFTPSNTGLYRLNIAATSSKAHGWNLLTTVQSQKSKYTKRAVQQAQLARKIQNIIGQPGVRQFTDITQKHLLHNCPITKADIAAAEDIYSTNLGSLKGKTVSRANQHVTTTVDEVPPDIMHIHHDVTLAIDIMFINAIPFFITIS